MQKMTKLWLLVIAMISLGNYCTAMYRQYGPPLDLGQVSAFPQERPTVRTVSKQCLSDVLKVTVGASLCMTSLCGLKKLIFHCNDLENNINFRERDFTVCTDFVAGPVLGGIIISGLYTLYQTTKLTRHSWNLLTILGKKSLEKLS